MWEGLILVLSCRLLHSCITYCKGVAASLQHAQSVRILFLCQCKAACGFWSQADTWRCAALSSCSLQHNVHGMTCSPKVATEYVHAGLLPSLDLSLDRLLHSAAADSSGHQSHTHACRDVLAAGFKTLRNSEHSHIDLKAAKLFTNNHKSSLMKQVGS